MASTLADDILLKLSKPNMLNGDIIHEARLFFTRKKMHGHVRWMELELDGYQPGTTLSMADVRANLGDDAPQEVVDAVFGSRGAFGWVHVGAQQVDRPVFFSESVDVLQSLSRRMSTCDESWICLPIKNAGLKETQMFFRRSVFRAILAAIAAELRSAIRSTLK